jgi:hypothetical protein
MFVDLRFCLAWLIEFISNCLSLLGSYEFTHFFYKPKFLSLSGILHLDSANNFVFLGPVC